MNPSINLHVIRTLCSTWEYHKVPDNLQLTYNFVQVYAPIYMYVL